MDKIIKNAVIECLRNLQVLHGLKVQSIDDTVVIVAALQLSNDNLVVNCEFFLHRNTDSLHVDVRWERLDTANKIVHLGFSLPRSASFNCCQFRLGEEIDGRPRNFHLIEGFEFDSQISVEKMYSLGKGPKYRVNHAPAMISLINQYLLNLRNILVQDLEKIPGVAD